MINDGKLDCQDGSDENNSVSKNIWLCDGNLLNISDMCHGECNPNDWKLCPGNNGNHSCIPNEDWCPGDNSCGAFLKWCDAKYSNKGKCLPMYNQDYQFECQQYNQNMTISSEKSKKCKYLKRWVCNGEVLCAEEPCVTENGLKSCPMDFYLCESKCKPEFLACNKSCHKNGFYCEKQVESIIVPDGPAFKGYQRNMSFNTFEAFGYKRMVNLEYLEKSEMSYNEYYMYYLYLTTICSRVYSVNENELSGEKCCLPMNYRCDGTIECYDGETSVSLNLKVNSH